MAISNVHVEFADGRLRAVELPDWRNSASHTELLDALRTATNEAIARDRADFERRLAALPDGAPSGDDLRRLVAEVEAQ